MSAQPIPGLPVVLTIAGTDPCGGAGIQADLRAFSALGVAGASVVTSVVAQNTEGVTGIFKVPPSAVARQMDAVAKDLPISAVKIGLLSDARIVSTVAGRIGRRDLANVVLDPVIAASDGTVLLPTRGITRLKEDLLPRVLVVTPNIPEAEILSGLAITNEDAIIEAARRIGALGPKWVLVKGGHAEGTESVVDLLWDGTGVTRFEGERLTGGPVRGTGCLLSAAIAAGLAHGLSVTEAVSRAREFVAKAIRSALPIGKGSRVWVGPRIGPRPGWNEEARLMATRSEDQMLDESTPTTFDNDEWKW